MRLDVCCDVVCAKSTGGATYLQRPQHQQCHLLVLGGQIHHSSTGAKVATVVTVNICVGYLQLL